MRSALALVLVLGFFAALQLAPASARAGQVWTDGDGDGLPDTSPLGSVPIGADVTVDVWIDSQSFVWTDFVVFIERGDCLGFVNYGRRGCADCTFPPDNVSNPTATGIAYYGVPGQHGVSSLGFLTFRKNSVGRCCATPIIDVNNPFGTFSVLGSQTSYLLFQTASGSCWDAPPSGTEPTSWGGVKGDISVERGPAGTEAASRPAAARGSVYASFFEIRSRAARRAASDSGARKAAIWASRA